MMQHAIPEARESRNVGIDLFRGLLVVLVILGHFSELSRRESFLTWLGMGVRMPLFIGLTGYLFNLDHARTLTLPGLLRKHYRRLIIPWLTACLVVMTATGAIDWLAPWMIVMQPPFHLWFVPVILTFIITARTCRLPPSMILVIALPMSITAMYLLGIAHGTHRFSGWMPDRRYLIYPVYFALGMWVAQRPFDPRVRNWFLVVAGVGLLWWCRLYSHPSLAGEVAAALSMCMPLIALFPWIRGWTFALPLIAPIGRDSLFFYLWHPLAFALWAALHVSGLALLALSVASILVAWVLIARSTTLSTVLGVRPRARAPQDSASPLVEPIGGVVLPGRP